MPENKLVELLENLDKIFKDRPNYNKLLGGSGYRNGYEDGYKFAVKKYKAYRDEFLEKKNTDKK